MSSSEQVPPPKPQRRPSQPLERTQPTQSLFIGRRPSEGEKRKKEKREEQKEEKKEKKNEREKMKKARGFSTRDLYSSPSPPPPSSTPSSSLSPSSFNMIDIEVSEHQFQSVTFKTPTYCDVCKEFIWGIKNQGYKCKACKMKVHPSCRKVAPNCKSELKRTSSLIPNVTLIQEMGESQEEIRRRSSTFVRDNSCWILKLDSKIFERTTFYFDPSKIDLDPISSYHELFGFPPPMEKCKTFAKQIFCRLSRLNKEQNQSLMELQDMISFRFRVAALFSSFKPEFIPEMTPQMVNRQPQKSDAQKTVNIHFYFSRNSMENRMVSKLRLVDPLRAAVRKSILVCGSSCPVKSAGDAVLRRVGRKEYIWQLDVPLLSFDFAIDTYEKRGILQFFVSSKEQMMKEGYVFDENSSFQEEIRKTLQRNLHEILIPEEISEEALNERFCDERVAVKEKVHAVQDIMEPFSIKIHSVQNVDEAIHLPSEWLKEDSKWFYFVEVFLHYGDQFVTPKLYTLPSKSPVWIQGQVIDIGSIHTKVEMRMIPPETRICVTLFVAKEVKRKKKTEFFFGKDRENCLPLGSVTTTIADHTLRYKEGHHNLYLWPKMAADPSHTLLTNSDPKALVVHIEFPTFSRPIVKLDRFDHQLQAKNHARHQQAAEFVAKDSPSKGIYFDPLQELKKSDRDIIWRDRFVSRVTYPESLPQILLSCPPSDQEELRAFIDPIYKLPPLQIPLSVALELLDSKFTNIHVRQFAVNSLSNCTESEIGLWMLQLVQALKYEVTHLSSLFYLLLFRALHSKKLGFLFFWMLAAEISGNEAENHVGPSSSARFLLYIDAYLTFCGTEIRKLLVNQIIMMKDFTEIATKVQALKVGKPEQLQQERTHLVREIFQEKPFLEDFVLPTDPDRTLSGIIIEKCKVMVSATAPIWMTFESSEPDAFSYLSIFKKGDDLRKDILIIQMFKTMDHIWKEGGLDLRLSPYAVIMTGTETGLVEIVTHSVTCAWIQKREGGVRGALMSSGLLHWLSEKNPSPEELELAVENFICSCAGYCVASYVLGIGDRHNDNIMVTETGLFFHIDFGFILGDYLKFGMIDRETAPFILTSEFVKVMGGENSAGFAKFESLCLEAYDLLRKNTNLIISLFGMVLSSGIPGVSRFEDLYYLRTSLAVTMNEKEAESHFRKLIKESLNCKRTKLNFAAHILAN